MGLSDVSICSPLRGQRPTGQAPGQPNLEHQVEKLVTSRPRAPVHVGLVCRELWIWMTHAATLAIGDCVRGLHRQAGPRELERSRPASTPKGTPRESPQIPVSSFL